MPKKPVKFFCQANNYFLGTFEIYICQFVHFSYSMIFLRINGYMLLAVNATLLHIQLFQETGAAAVFAGKNLNSSVQNFGHECQKLL